VIGCVGKFLFRLTVLIEVTTLKIVHENVPCWFLDRDGVVIENRSDYVKSVKEVSYIDRSLVALRMLASTMGKIALVTNQSPVGRGIITQEDVDEINSTIITQVQLEGGRIDGVYVCPHRPNQNCKCRKPETGLLEQGLKQLEIIVPENCVMIGDNVSDVFAGKEMGMKSILLLSGVTDREQALALSEDTDVDVYDDLLNFVEELFR
jgi:D-glycero-D-manno-heptose 1,7-bisphosphate phosphatase